MNRSNPTTQALAARLVACEAEGGTFSGNEKLRPHLTTLMGNAGYRALLMRALTLASAQVAWLGLVRVAADGTLEVPAKLDPPVGPEEIRQGRVALAAELLELLVAFIGESLTLRLIYEIWPNAAPGSLKPKNHKNEKKQ